MSHCENEDCFLGYSPNKCKNCTTSDECLNRMKEKSPKLTDDTVLSKKEYLNNLGYSFRYLNSLSEHEIEEMARDLDYEDLS